MNKFNANDTVAAASAPSRDEARDALETLRQFAAIAPAEATALGFGAGAVGALNRTYPADFAPDAAYKATMPDLQNGPSSLIKGEKTGIQHVGISNFRLPLAYLTRDGAPLTLETSVTGSVSLEASKKGINMSRIMRSFYRHADTPFHFERISEVLDGYVQRDGATVIDLRSSTVLPGLMDMHVHLETEINKASYTERFTLNEADIAFRSAVNAEVTLMAGFTTVRDRAQRHDQNHGCNDQGKIGDDEGDHP